MNINVRTNISQDYGENIEIVVNTSKFTKEVGEIIETIQQIANSEISSIIGKNGNEISVINLDEIICFYSREQNNCCKTSNGEFVIKQKLYELEESLPKNDFIRISNSTIINIKFVQCFDVSIIGNILVKFKDGSSEYVSKRRVSRSYEIFEGKREEIVMKKVMKNMFKSISVACLIFVILSIIIYGIQAVLANKLMIENNEEFIANIPDIAEGMEGEDREKVYKDYVAFTQYILPTSLYFNILLRILFYSIIIGGTIGIAISVDEFSKKRITITYVGVYAILVIILFLIEKYGYASIYYISNGIEFCVEFLLIYTVLFGFSILGKRLYNKKQSKLMNKELNIDINNV